MAQTGFSPLKIYASSTAGNTPSASKLINDTSGSELAINIYDGKLFYKDSTGTVQVIATKASAAITFPLSVSNGGIGSGTLTGLAYGNGTSAFTAATAAQVVAVISTTAVTNATNATTATTATTANALNTGNAYTGTSFSDSLGNLRNIPINSKSTGYTLLATDNGQCISISTGGVTVPNSVFSAGQTVAVFNNSGSNQTITQGSGVTMYLGGSSTTGNRTLSGYGLATLLYITSSVVVITGAGLS